MIQTSARRPRRRPDSRRGPASMLESGPLEPPGHGRRSGSVRNVRSKRMLAGRLLAAALDVGLLEDRQAPRGPGGPIRRASGACRRRPGPRIWMRFEYSRQFGTSGTRSMPKRPPGASTRATEVERRREIAVADQRLQDAVRREHRRELAVRKRQGADVAAHQRTGRCVGAPAPARWTRAPRPGRAARASIGATDRCRRVRRRRGRAAARSGRCRTRVRARAPGCDRASWRQNATSLRPSVRAFSQS